MSPPERDRADPAAVPSGVGPTDAQLVARSRREDLAAFALLVGRHRDRFLRYAHYMLGTREDAEEAVQDTMVRAFRSLGRCDPDRFGAWAHRILVNRCRSAAGRRRWWRTQVTELSQAVGVGVPHPAGGRELREEIERALAALAAEQREAFLLKHVEELGYEEISDLTGASVPALKMRVKRACERLRAALGDRI